MDADSLSDEAQSPLSSPPPTLISVPNLPQYGTVHFHTNTHTLCHHIIDTLRILPRTVQMLMTPFPPFLEHFSPQAHPPILSLPFNQELIMTTAQLYLDYKIHRIGMKDTTRKGNYTCLTGMLHTRN